MGKEWERRGDGMRGGVEKGRGELSGRGNLS
jgi:hypothetical protein